MASLTVLVAPVGVSDGVRAVLTDLSAAGLVNPFLWLTDPVGNALPSVFTAVENGRTRDIPQQQIIEWTAIERIRICILVPLVGDDAPLTVAQESGIAGILSATFGGAQTTRMRALLARPGMLPRSDAELAVAGWHNLLIAPEDGRGPQAGLGRVALPATGSAAGIGRHAAPVIAGALGLWAGPDYAPLDHDPMRPGNVVRLARSYYRRVETGEAEGDLRRQLLLDDGRLPLPSTQQGQIVYADRDASAAEAMANRFWQKNSHHFIGSRTEYPKPAEKKKLKAWEAIKLFFSFMWSALRNAPGLWLKSVVDKFSQGVASTIDRTVFGGGDSDYEVVFNGRTARGKPAGWDDIARASSKLNNSLVGGTSGGTVRLGGARADFSQVWQDYSQAALTLADARPRNPDLPPAQSGFNRAIIRESANVVPGPGAKFDQISGVVAAAIDINSVDATDKLGIDFLRFNLTEFERARPESGEARAALTKLDAWQQEHAGSFGVMAGGKLAEAFNFVYSEVQDLLRKLTTAHEPPPEPDDKNKKLIRWIQLGFLLSVLVTAGVVYFNRIGRLAWWAAACIAVGLLVVGIWTIAWNYMKNQRELFQVLHRRQTMIDTRVVQEKRLLEALHDLERNAQAYSEYLAWSRALGAYLESPLGPNVYVSSSVLKVGWGLPLSTAIGYAAPADSDISATISHLRADLFREGWLTTSWEQLVRQASPQQFGVVDADLTRSPLWSEPGVKSGSNLDRWSEALFNRTLISSGAEQAWRNALQQLGGPMAHLRGTLVSRVTSSAGGLVPTHDFLAQLDEAAGFADNGSFLSSLLDASAVVNGANRVVKGYPVRYQEGVGLVCALTQFSDSIAVNQLRFDNIDEGTGGAIEPPPAMPGSAFGPSAFAPGQYTGDDDIRPPEGVQGLS